MEGTAVRPRRGIAALRAIADAGRTDSAPALNTRAGAGWRRRFRSLLP